MGEEKTFREFHDEVRKINRRGFRRLNPDNKPFVREDIGRPKGKAAIKAAKRERVRQLKAAADLKI